MANVSAKESLPSKALPVNNLGQIRDQQSLKPKVKTVVEPSLQIQIPASLLKQLKLAAIDGETSVRAIVLTALAAYGFKVGEIEDRRKKRRQFFGQVSEGD